MIRDEKMTVSPSASLSSCVPEAIRPSAARGSPCPPVAMISSSLLRQPHRLVEADRRREVAADSRSPGRRAGSARANARRCTPCVRFRVATRPIVCSRAAFEAKVVTSTRPVGLIVCASKPFVNALLGARRPLLEDVGRIAHQREHACVADLRQRLGARRLADHRRFVDLPVAGVEDVAERRLDQQAIALRDRVRQRDEADLERAELDAPAALDDVELDLAGQPLLLELAGDQARR